MITPVIATARLQLVPFTTAHIHERYVGWLNDPDVVRYSENRHSHHTMESCQQYVADMQASEHLFWAIERRDDAPAHIGNITAYLDRPNNVADVAIMIGETDARSRGLGTEAWCAVVAHLLDTRGIRRVQAGTMAPNTAMRGVFHKSGMTEEGRQHGRFLLDEKPVDLVFAARTRDDTPNLSKT